MSLDQPRAIDWLRQFFSGPAQQELFEQVIDFYGESLSVFERNDRSAISRYSLNTNSQHLDFRGATIFLNTFSPARIPQAAAHEFLHLALFSEGLPIIRGFASPDNEVFGNQIEETLEVAHNAVDHSLFYERFRQCGYELTDMVVPPSRPPAYKDLINSKELSQSLQMQIGWVFSSYLALEYMRHRSNQQIGFGDSGKQAESVIYWASRKFPHFRSVAGAISAWMDKRSYVDFETYPAAMGELFRLMEMPIRCEYMRMDKSDGRIRLAAA